MARQGLEALRELGSDAPDNELELTCACCIPRHWPKAGRYSESMALYRNAAELAIAHGDAERLAQAALGYDDPCWRFNLPGVHAQHLLNQAFQALGEHDSACVCACWPDWPESASWMIRVRARRGCWTMRLRWPVGSAIHVH